MSKKSEAQKLAARKASAKKGAATRAANQAAAGNNSEQPVAEEAPAERPLRAGLISINEHNDIRMKHWRSPDSRLPVPNGIGCPNCGDELVDRTPGLVDWGSPPRIEVRCSSVGCEYRAKRVA